MIARDIIAPKGGIMRTAFRILAACMVAVMLMSCAGRRARQAEERQRIMNELNQSGCTAQAAGACPSCNIRCPVGQAAQCKPGEAVGNQCAVQPSCKCS